MTTTKIEESEGRKRFTYSWMHFTCCLPFAPLSSTGVIARNWACCLPPPVGERRMVVVAVRALGWMTVMKSMFGAQNLGTHAEELTVIRVVKAMTLHKASSPCQNRRVPLPSTCMASQLPFLPSLSGDGTLERKFQTMNIQS
jgi:hypothetical protein